MEFSNDNVKHTKILKKSIRKVSDLFFFFQKPGGFQWRALAWGDLELSYACMNFFLLSITSVDGKHLSEVVLCSCWIWFPGHTHTPNTCHQWLWCTWSRGHCLWSPACPVRLQHEVAFAPPSAASTWILLPNLRSVWNVPKKCWCAPLPRFLR